jgi:hypothetical protein
MSAQISLLENNKNSPRSHDVTKVIESRAQCHTGAPFALYRMDMIRDSIAMSFDVTLGRGETHNPTHMETI